MNNELAGLVVAGDLDAFRGHYLCSVAGEERTAGAEPYVSFRAGADDCGGFG